jgi:excisionase family DNA binding protein
LDNISRVKEEEGLEKEVMTAAELAEYLSFSKNWVYRKAEAGEIPGVKLGNRWRFKKTVIDKWLEKRIAAAERGGLGEF